MKNGGFLTNPEDFFTDPQARDADEAQALLYRGALGYSPNILAYELFNEVEFTDAAQGKLWDDVALWHREMALFLRQFDGNRHLLTTSSAPSIAADSPIWETVDYVQTHAYPTDLLTTLLTPETTFGKKKTDKPGFVGEFGPKGSEGRRRGAASWDLGGPDERACRVSRSTGTGMRSRNRIFTATIWRCRAF